MQSSLGALLECQPGDPEADPLGADEDISADDPEGQGQDNDVNQQSGGDQPPATTTDDQPTTAAATADSDQKEALSALKSVEKQAQKIAEKMAPGKTKQPEKLPVGWTSQHDAASGKTFYINTATGHTQWEKPAEKAGKMGNSKANNEGGNGRDQHHSNGNGNGADKHQDKDKSLDKTKQLEKLPVGWTSQHDAASGKTFYINTATGHTQWEKPPVAKSPVSPGKIVNGNGADKHQDKDKSTELTKQLEKLPVGWTSQHDAASGKTFYINTATGHTQWEKPPVAKSPVSPGKIVNGNGADKHQDKNKGSDQHKDKGEDDGDDDDGGDVGDNNDGGNDADDGGDGAEDDGVGANASNPTTGVMGGLMNMIAGGASGGANDDDGDGDDGVDTEQDDDVAGTYDQLLDAASGKLNVMCTRKIESRLLSVASYFVVPFTHILSLTCLHSLTSPLVPPYTPSHTGKAYYVNKATKVAQWDPPSLFKNKKTKPTKPTVKSQHSSSHNPAAPIKISALKTQLKSTLGEALGTPSTPSDALQQPSPSLPSSFPPPSMPTSLPPPSMQQSFPLPSSAQASLPQLRSTPFGPPGTPGAALSPPPSVPAFLPPTSDCNASSVGATGDGGNGDVSDVNYVDIGDVNVGGDGDLNYVNDDNFGEVNYVDIGDVNIGGGIDAADDDDDVDVDDDDVDADNDDVDDDDNDDDDDTAGGGWRWS